MAHATIAVFHRRLAGRQGHRSLSRMQARVILMTASVYRAAVMRERRPVGPRVRPSPYDAARSVRPRLESASSPTRFNRPTNAWFFWLACLL
jgi:hypothetical protein